MNNNINVIGCCVDGNLIYWLNIIVSGMLNK